jgi:serine protease Do
MAGFGRIGDWCWAIALLIGWVSWSTGFAAEASPATEKSKIRLTKIFAVSAPESVADLKMMQVHLQQMTDKLLTATVGVQVGGAWGSGVIITKDGTVLTAAHVAGQPNRDVIFIFADGKIAKGKTLGLNRSLDAGLMQITDKGEWPFVAMGGSGDVKEGQWCVATGHPGGYFPDRKPVLRMGRVLHADSMAITTDCTLVGGDSGGPLFNMEGHVIGINSRISGPLTANMHVPMSAFRDDWDKLASGVSWGHYPGQEPYIGVRGDKDAKDATIASVVSDSPAERAGLKAGDVILKMNEKAIESFEALTDFVRERNPGDKVRLSVKRGDDTVELSLRIGKRGGPG